VSANAILSGGAAAPDGLTPPVSPPATLVASTSPTEATDVTGFVWKAKVESKVYENYPNNLGGYTFEYNVANTGGSAFSGAISALFLSIGASPSLDVQYLTGTGTVPRGAFLDGSGELLTWFWAFATDPGLESGPGAGPGETSATLVVHTPYKAMARATAALYGGGTGQVFGVYVPVPESSAYAGIFALGLAGFAAYRRFQA